MRFSVTRLLFAIAFIGLLSLTYRYHQRIEQLTDIVECNRPLISNAQRLKHLRFEVESAELELARMQPSIEIHEKYGTAAIPQQASLSLAYRKAVARLRNAEQKYAMRRTLLIEQISR